MGIIFINVYDDFHFNYTCTKASCLRHHMYVLSERKIWLLCQCVGKGHLSFQIFRTVGKLQLWQTKSEIRIRSTKHVGARNAILLKLRFVCPVKFLLMRFAAAFSWLLCQCVGKGHLSIEIFRTVGTFQLGQTKSEVRMPSTKPLDARNAILHKCPFLCSAQF